MSEKPPQLSYILAPAMRGPVEVTLRALLESYEHPIGVDYLGGTMNVLAVLSAFGLVSEPPLGSAELDAPIVIRPAGQSSIKELAEAAISAGEGSRVEFKSTLLLSVHHWEQNPKPLLSACRSEKVIKSALKTVAAFLNTSGGTLLIGISDNGTCYGLQEDMELADPNKADFDGWELELRKLIERHFPSKSINSYISVDKFQMGCKTAARIEVGSKRELSFFRTEGTEQLYIRSGNRSIPVHYSDIEHYFSMTKKYV